MNVRPDIFFPYQNVTFILIKDKTFLFFLNQLKIVKRETLGYKNKKKIYNKKSKLVI